MAKKQKRMSREELRKPDALQEALAPWWDKLEQHWKMLVVGCLAILLAGVASSAYKRASATSAADGADAFTAAVAPVTAPTGEDDSTTPESALPIKPVERYADEAAARAEARTRLDAYIAEEESGAHVDAARLLRAGLEVEDAGARLTALQALSGNEDLAALQPSIQMGIADALLATGDRGAATAKYQEVADATTGMAKALALMAKGDASNPLAGGSDAAAAKTAYAAAKAALGPRPTVDAGDVFAAFGEPYIYAELDNKLALLD